MPDRISVRLTGAPSTAKEFQLQIRKPLPISDANLAARLARPEFPRASRYDPWWIVENRMGPHPLWLAEALLDVFPLNSGARVMDLGCGKALTSIFLALETNVEVWATDLWVSAGDNSSRIAAAGLADRVFPIHADARQLPYAPGFFDVIVSFDAYHYFGTDELYLAYLQGFLKPGGSLGIVVPGLTTEIEDVPEHLQGWFPNSAGFHSPDWWRRHLDSTKLMTVERADLVPDGWRQWSDWCQICAGLRLEPIFSGSDVQTIQEGEAIGRDAGRTIGFTRIVARRT